VRELSLGWEDSTEGKSNPTPQWGLIPMWKASDPNPKRRVILIQRASDPNPTMRIPPSPFVRKIARGAVLILSKESFIHYPGVGCEFLLCVSLCLPSHVPTHVETEQRKTHQISQRQNILHNLGHKGNTTDATSGKSSYIGFYFWVFRLYWRKKKKQDCLIGNDGKKIVWWN
jgi:hypothetical protein